LIGELGWNPRSHVFRINFPDFLCEEEWNTAFVEPQEGEATWRTNCNGHATEKPKK